MSDHDYIAKINIVGEHGIGRDSLLDRYISDMYLDPKTPMCIGLRFEIKKSKINKLKIKQQIWGPVHQEKFIGFNEKYYRNTDIVLLCFDMTCISTIDILHKYIKDINEVASCDYILIGTKSDMNISNTTNPIILNFLLSNPMSFIITSSKVSTGFDQLESEVNNILLKRIRSGKLKEKVVQNDTPKTWYSRIFGF